MTEQELKEYTISAKAHSIGYDAGYKDAILDFAAWLEKRDYLNKINIDYDWDEMPYETYEGLTKEEIVKEFLESEGVE